MLDCRVRKPERYDLTLDFRGSMDMKLPSVYDKIPS